jgi:hypothetical protein
MAQYIVTAPDGKEITLEGPAGASQADVIAQAQKLYQPTQAQPQVQVTPELPVWEKPQTQFAETGGGAALGRPVRNVAQVQAEPRPLESALAGATKSAVIDPVLGVSQLLSGGNVGGQAAQSYAEQAKPYQETNPGSYLTGQIGGALAPGLGMAKGAGMIPSFARANPLIQGVTFGAAQGAITPEATGKTGLDYYQNQLQQAGIGAVIGAVPSVISSGAKALSSGLRRGLGMTTGAGEEAIGQAYQAGKTGNQAFVQNLKGEVPTVEILDEAKQALSNIRANRMAGYKEGIKSTMPSQEIVAGKSLPTPMKRLDFDPITSKLDETIQSLKVETPTTSKFKIGKEELSKVKELESIVGEWKKDSTLHTAEGLDALKQRLDALYPESPMQRQAQRAITSVRNAVKDTIVSQDKNYAKTMKAYEESLTMEREIERALSLGDKASADTAIRKLQSLTRNNANTSFAYRKELADALKTEGGVDLMPALSGQALSSWTPRGMAGQGTALGIGATGALTVNPMAAALLPLTSPRLVGATAYGAGKMASKLPSSGMTEEQKKLAQLLMIKAAQEGVK